MIRNKISTLEQLKGSFASLLISSTFALGLLIFKYAYQTFDENIALMGALLISVSLFTLLHQILFWCARNQAFEYGLKYSVRYYFDKRSVQKQFIEAGIYTPKVILGLEIATLPNIVVEYDEGYLTGRVYIEKNIKLSEKLDKVDISPALKRFVVEQITVSENGKYSVHEFYDHSLDRKYEFDSLEELQHHTSFLDDYKINIDKRTSVPLSHSLIVGQTRSGKSYMLMVSILQMLSKRLKYHLYFIDPKGSDIGVIGKKVEAKNTAVEYEDIVQLLEKFVSQMQIRKKTMQKKLENQLSSDYRTFELSPHILVFDEYASFAISLRTKSKADRDHISDMISEIVLQGSQLGFFIWIAMQKSDSNNIPTAIRDNLMLKIVLGNAEKQTYVTAFGDVDLPNIKFEAGEGLYTYPSLTVKPSICSISKLNFDSNKAFDDLS